MIDAECLKILCCPETHQPLHIAAPDTIAKLNKMINDRVLVGPSGNIIEEKVDGALIRDDRKILYPIREQIPQLLTTESIVLLA
jgi:uncharacterized protein YbaR (Trm112 family)